MPRMAIAGPSGLVTDAAARIAEVGGSVVDAAIVAALTAMCTEPGVCAPGGGGFLTIDILGNRPVVIDGYIAQPGKGFEGEPVGREIWMEYGGGMTSIVGSGSVAVPGVFAGLAMASDMFGVAPWRELMEMVAMTIEDGFPLGRAAHHYLTYAGEPIFSHDETVRTALFNGDRLLEVGEPVLIQGLASTLRYIGEEGASVFYKGDLGHAIADDLASSGGQLTRKDLETYEAIPRTPLTINLRDWRLDVNPPPAVGGVTVAIALKAAAESNLSGPPAWAEALVSAFQIRSDELEPHHDLSKAAEHVLLRAGLQSPSTISIAAADDEGGAVAGTFSAGYGSGVAPAGSGLMMNNGMGEIELCLGGLKAEHPGRRMMSNMAPTVARRGPDVVAIGSPGADRITSALMVTLEWLVAGMNLEEAIEHPRVHPEFGDWGVRIATEPGLDLDGIHYPVRSFADLDMFFGGVNGTALEGGELHGHADSRRQGSVVLVG
ncbi:MAG: gamma-glutamyltransferase [Actinomycetota bacterium]|nr:gamma-glutamyltransferase [Actinomycetota bacterium]